MATITLSDKAPQEDVSFTIGNYELDLTPGGSYDTEDALLLGAASVNPWLTVEYPPAPTQTEAADYDVNDPHDNPAADHLSPQATLEVKEAANEADAAVQQAAFPNDPTAGSEQVASETSGPTGATAATGAAATGTVTTPTQSAPDAATGPSTTGASS